MKPASGDKKSCLTTWIGWCIAHSWASNAHPNNIYQRLHVSDHVAGLMNTSSWKATQLRNCFWSEDIKKSQWQCWMSSAGSLCWDWMTGCRQCSCDFWPGQSGRREGQWRCLQHNLRVLSPSCANTKSLNGVNMGSPVHFWTYIGQLTFTVAFHSDTIVR